MSGIFLDTNILVYAFSHTGQSEAARELLGSADKTGVQNLSEFANVARNKLRMPWSDVRESLDQIRSLCTIVAPLDLTLHERGAALAERHGFAFFDGLVVAAALGSDCDLLLSEDMHDGLVVEGRLTIRNPFRPIS